MKHTPETINKLAVQAGIPYGAHAFVIVQKSANHGLMAERGYLVGKDPDGLRGEAEKHAAKRARDYPSSTFYVLEIGAPADPAAVLRQMLEDGFEISAAAKVIGDFQVEKEPHLQAYRDAVETSDELECDDNAIVSAGSDKGAFVATWTWVSNESAGIEADLPEGAEDMNPDGVPFFINGDEPGVFYAHALHADGEADGDNIIGPYSSKALAFGAAMTPGAFTGAVS